MILFAIIILDMFGNKIIIIIIIYNSALYTFFLNEAIVLGGFIQIFAITSKHIFFRNFAKIFFF